MATTNGKELTAQISGQAPVKVTIQNLLDSANVKVRIENILKERAGAFTTSVIQLVNATPQLQKCKPNSVIAACLTAATLDLPINPQLGFAAIVPYGEDAQFQPMWRAYIQLGIRTGQYKKIIITEVYEDELKGYNPITEEIEFTPQETWTMRYTDKGKVAGYYAYFSLISGFEKFVYMTVKECEKHGKKYSQLYRSNKGKWVEDFDAMGRKTVLKRLLSRYGIMSVEIQRLMESDASADSDTVPVDNFYADDDSAINDGAATVMDLSETQADAAHE